MGKEGTVGLQLCGRGAAFREITEGEYIAALSKRDAVRKELQARYPGFLTDRDGTTDGLAEATWRFEMIGVRLPLLQVAWAGEGTPPTEAEFLAEKRGAILAACYACRAANPDMLELPEDPAGPKASRP